MEPGLQRGHFLKVCQLKQLVDERHCSLAEAKKKLDAKDSATPTITRSVEDEDSGWEAVIDDFIDRRRQVNRATTMRDLTCRMKRVLKTLEKKPRPQSGADLMKAYARQHFKHCRPPVDQVGWCSSTTSVRCFATRSRNTATTPAGSRWITMTCEVDRY